MKNGQIIQMLFSLSLLSHTQLSFGQQNMRDVVCGPHFRRIVARTYEAGDSMQRFSLMLDDIAVGGPLPPRAATLEFGSDRRALESELLLQGRITEAAEASSWYDHHAGDSACGFFECSRFLPIDVFESLAKSGRPDLFKTGDTSLLSVLRTLSLYQQFKGDRSHCRALLPAISELIPVVSAIAHDNQMKEVVKINSLVALICYVDVHFGALLEEDRREILQLFSSSNLTGSVFDRCLQLQWYRAAGVVVPLLNVETAARNAGAVIDLHDISAFQGWLNGINESPMCNEPERRVPLSASMLNELIVEMQSDQDFVPSKERLQRLVDVTGGTACLPFFLRSLLQSGRSRQIAASVEVTNEAMSNAILGVRLDGSSLSDAVDLRLLTCVALRSLGRTEDATREFKSLVRDTLERDPADVFWNYGLSVGQLRPIMIRLAESSSADDDSVEALSSFCLQNLVGDNIFVPRAGVEFLQTAGYMWAASHRDPGILEYLAKRPEFSDSFCAGVGRRISYTDNGDTGLEVIRLFDDAGVFDNPQCVIEFLRNLGGGNLGGRNLCDTPYPL